MSDESALTKHATRWGQAKVNRKAGEEAKDGVLLGMMIEKGDVKTLRGKSGPTRCDDAETIVIAVKYGRVFVRQALGGRP